jgi:hypothetical protein
MKKVSGGQLLALPGAVDDTVDGQFAEDRHVATIVALGQPPHGAALGRLGLGAEVAVARSGDEGRQQGVTEAEELSEESPFHRVDALAVSGGLLDEVPQSIELVLGLESGLLGCDDHGEVPWCGFIGCVETDVLPQRGLAFNCLPTQLLASKRSPG